ncbi:MAG: hypothetical protein KC944_09380 [Candidatus Omnitrophica bacterium]|nr:hypothetical protein [Candidatus Omnitrophota bacterium]
MELDPHELKKLMKEAIREELGASDCRIAKRWKDGLITLHSDNPTVQPKEIPMDAFFKKITSVREKLRVLEQKLNNHKSLTPEEKLEFQTLISRAYGSLTTFNILFEDEEDRFVGVKG